jgi:hypothetical protein
MPNTLFQRKLKKGKKLMAQRGQLLAFKYFDEQGVYLSHSMMVGW